VQHVEQAKLQTFLGVRTFSSIAIALVTLLSAIFASWLGSDSLNWQVAIALIALAIGIPHGALDHLVTLPRTQPLKMAIFIAIYVAIALLAIWAILQWNVWGFIAVVAMSSLHFGVGDSAFIAELDHLQSRASKPTNVWTYALTAGCVPVLVPLTNSRSTEALEQVNPALINWHQGFDAEILIALTVVAAISTVTLLALKRYRDLLDLALLSSLVLIAPPLVAFATYFGCWHALRHTARLTSLLPASQRHHREGNSLAALRSAVLPGIPALIGTLVFVAILATVAQESVTDRFLWLTLVTIWALTVPHMIVTARLDRAALKN
jgi:Brp/Blh family beta-carotene 15,15'-monooxygenase